MGIESFYRGNTKKYRFEFREPNPLYTGRAPIVVVTSTAGVYDEIEKPVDVNQLGITSEDWTLTFDSAVDFTIVGSVSGTVGQGSVSIDNQPHNPDKSAPYWSLPSGGFSGTFLAGDTITFTTVIPTVAVDIGTGTPYQITLTFITEGAATPTLQITATAGADVDDDTANGIMYLEVTSGDSKNLTEDNYQYGFERNIPHATNVDLDNIRTLQVGEVEIRTPAKVIVPD